MMVKIHAFDYQTNETSKSNNDVGVEDGEDGFASKSMIS
jgi:hypothetical protein